MSATLKLKETPQSCRDCEICFSTNDLYGVTLYCVKMERYVDDCTDTRHPDCPLEITDDNLRWIRDKLSDNYWRCPKCNFGANIVHTPPGYLKHCSQCGTELSQPEEV